MNKLKDKNIDELTKICKKLNVNSGKTKKSCIETITKEITRRKTVSDNISKKYVPIKQLGNKGKEARTYLAVDSKTKKIEFAIKTYRKNKSLKSLAKQVDFQKRASNVDISPKIYDYDIEGRLVVMEKLDEDLVDVITRQKGKLTIKQQREIINIFCSLDKLKIFHADANLLNFMYKNNKLYIIDFGFSEEINTRNINKFNSNTPNLDFMPIAFLVQAKKIFPESKFSHIEKYVKIENAEKISFKQI